MKVKVCVIQDSPIFFNKEKTIDKVESLVQKHAKEGSELIVFPESFIPGYPRGFTFGAKIGSRSDIGQKQYLEYLNNSISAEKGDLKKLAQISKNASVYLVIGATERDDSSGSLYCSMLYFSPTDGHLGTHRKIKPTGTERVIWSEDDGASLVTFQTKIGKLGGLICWENYMPMARMAMYKKGVEIYMAPTADARKEWTHTMIHIALEGRCFVLGCNQYFNKSMVPKQYLDSVSNEPEEMCPGGSVIISPNGEVLAGPLFGKAGALIAELELDDIVKSKLGFDVVGHYSRDDIFELSIKHQPEIKKENSYLENK